jgi:2-polyprenyl-3-methyl-5-hydroxy-6-metoxy-1,4-benzoquinol methylase
MKSASQSIKQPTDALDGHQSELTRLLASEKFGYQQVTLPNGLSTPGKSRAATIEKIFPPDMSGLSVVDIGCNHGQFCFEAEKRGAARITGLDYSPGIVRRTRKLAKLLKSKAVFEVRDLNREPLKENYDVVLCLNVLHHLDDPIEVIANMVDKTNQRLVLEMAGLNILDYVKRLHVVPFYAFLLAWMPIIFVGRMPYDSKGGRAAGYKLKYYITPSALLRMLSLHSERIERIEKTRSGYKGRYIVICHMKQRPEADGTEALTLK